MIRIYNENGSQNCLTSTRKGRGILLIHSSFYDKDGYYDGGKSFDSEISEDDFDREIKAAKELGLRVEVYQDL